MKGLIISVVGLCFMLYVSGDIKAKNLYITSKQTNEIITIKRKDPLYNRELNTILLNEKNENQMQLNLKSSNAQFSCFIPKIIQSTSSQEQINEDELNKPVDSFLDVLSGKCYVWVEGWWSYEFCYHKHIRQFHVEQDGSVNTYYYLGNYKNSDTKYTMLNDYVVETYASGSKCDLTGLPRSSEIRYRCTKEGTYIFHVKEPSSCNYVVQIYTDTICKHPKYKLEDENIEKILCLETPLEPVELAPEKENNQPQDTEPIIVKTLEVNDKELDSDRELSDEEIIKIAKEEIKKIIVDSINVPDTENAEIFEDDEEEEKNKKSEL